jgi:DNA-binding NarL/FixJ family response regulator
MDVRMPNQTGIDATKAILEACPEVRMLVLTVSEDTDVLRQAVAAGAAGYMLKDTGVDSLAAGIRAVHRGEIMISSEMTRHLLKGDSPESRNTSRRPDGLTHREIKILSEVARGLGDKEIAAKMFLSESTIKSHLRNVYRRLKVQNRAQATAYALQNGLLAEHGLTIPAANGSAK